MVLSEKHYVAQQYVDSQGAKGQIMFLFKMKFNSIANFKKLLVATFSIVSIILVVWGCKSTALAEPKRENSVSMIRIISFPERYNGKELATIGFGIIRFKENVLYLSESDAEYGNFLNSLELNFKDSKYSLSEVEKFDRKHLYIKGIFQMSDGTFGSPDSGTITKIQEIHTSEDWGRFPEEWEATN